MEFTLVFMYLLLASSAVNRIGDDSTQSNMSKQDVSVYITMYLVYLVNTVFNYEKMIKEQKYYCNLKWKILKRRYIGYHQYIKIPKILKRRNIGYHQYIKIQKILKRRDISCHQYIKNILSYGIGFILQQRFSVVLIDDL